MPCERRRYAVLFCFIPLLFYFCFLLSPVLYFCRRAADCGERDTNQSSEHRHTYLRQSTLRYSSLLPLPSPALPLSPSPPLPPLPPLLISYLKGLKNVFQLESDLFKLLLSAPTQISQAEWVDSVSLFYILFFYF